MRHIIADTSEKTFIAALNLAQSEPVTVDIGGTSAAVMFSVEEYERMWQKRMQLFNGFCDRVGMEAERRGLTEDTLQELLNEDD